MRNCLISSVSALFLLATAPAWAHHALGAEFDANRPVRLKGTVIEMDWTNPHVWIYLDVKTPGGKVEKWQIEAGAPRTLQRRGWTKRSVAVGMEVIVEGYAAKDGSHRANGRDLLVSDTSLTMR